MSSRQIATSTLWQLASQVTMAALSILTVKFVAMGLSKELAGNYNSAYGMLQLAGILADFGLYAVAVKELSRTDRKEEILGALIILRLITLGIAVGATLLFVWFLPMWKGTPLPLGVTIAALVPLFTLLAGIIRSVFQINYKMHFVFIAEVLQRITTVTLIGLFIVMGIRGSHDLHIYHLFLFIGGIGSFVLFLISLSFADRMIHVRPRWNVTLLKELLKKASPYGVAFICMAFYRQWDVTLIAILRDDFELQNAYYGFVARMADMGFIIPTFLLNSILPILSDRDAKGEDVSSLLSKTLLMLLALGSISLLFSVFWSRPLIQLLTTDAYLSTPMRPGSDTALRLIGAPVFLNGLVLFGFYTLLTRGVWKRLVASLLLGVILSLALNLYLIPAHGFVGAAVTSILVHIILAILLMKEARRILPFQMPVRYLTKWLVFSALLGVSLWWSAPLLVSEIHTIVGLAVAGAALALFAWASGLLKAVWIRE